jgi:peptidoglycan/LPS O-acetylase OafA/YrhL
MPDSYLIMQKQELQNRNFGLDLIRCLAILLVLACHSLLAFYNTPQLQATTAYLGILGVDLFFVLSGFLIGTILIKIHAKEKTLSFKSVKSFWIRRWFRTLPNFFLIFIIYLLVFKAYHLYIPYHKLPLYVVFLQTCFSRNQWFYGVAWSLSIEEWFYLLFPLGLLLFQRLVINNKIKILLINIACFVAVCMAVRLFFSLYMHNEWDDGFRKQMPFRLDSIAIGVLAAVVKFYYEGFWKKYQSLLLITGICLFSLLSAILYYTFLQYNVLYGNFFINVLYFPLMSVAIALFLPFVYSLHSIKSGTIRYGVTYVSILSYSIYLIHPIFSYLIPYYFHDKLSPAIMLMLLWVLTFAASHLIYNLFEKRVTHLRDKFSYKNEPAAA